MDTRKKREKH
uniref:Urease accessory protein n=1 Tax=Helicobacter pylori TaxID=210 RepID=Q8VN85_HELPX|nr:urease accessory protein [Helicobacter pylori]